ncbi:MAG: glycosyltransferase [Candidatus Didemnitutus sp.]|nr:glycosyltransferase [Candidatus Didemnitutus sp.]
MPRRVLLHSHHRTFKVRYPWRTEGIAQALAAAGSEVTILCTADTARWRRRESAHDGVRFVEVPDLLRGRQRSGWDLWSAWHRHTWLRRQHFDLIHCLDTRPAVIHPTLAHLRRAPSPLVIDWADWWGRGGLIEENRPAWYRFAFERLETHYEERYRRHADATTVIARGLAERAVGLGVPRDSIFWLPNGCAPQRIPVVPPATHRAEFGLPADAFVVGFNAADVTIGFSLVLAAFAQAAAALPQAHLLLTGNLPTDARALLARTPHADRVHALGFVATDAYTCALTCADVFLLPFTDRPANRGRWPGRINDYLSTGRPIVTQPFGEMETLLREEPIGLLADDTPSAVAAALTTLACDPLRRAALGRHARHLAETRLSWPELSATLEAAYACAERRRVASK